MKLESQLATNSKPTPNVQKQSDTLQSKPKLPTTPAAIETSAPIAPTTTQETETAGTSEMEIEPGYVEQKHCVDIYNLPQRTRQNDDGSFQWRDEEYIYALLFLRLDMKATNINVKSFTRHKSKFGREGIVTLELGTLQCKLDVLKNSKNINKTHGYQSIVIVDSDRMNSNKGTIDTKL